MLLFPWRRSLKVQGIGFCISKWLFGPSRNGCRRWFVEGTGEIRIDKSHIFLREVWGLSLRLSLGSSFVIADRLFKCRPRGLISPNALPSRPFFITGE